VSDDELRRLMTKLAAAAHLVSAELDDLIGLAYESTVSDSVQVAGGDVVDLHAVGDQRARTALAGIDRHAYPLLEILNNAMHLLHATGPQDAPTPRTRRQISRKEHGEAIDAQARRKARGDYTPHRTLPQPGIH
jgi:hypothetical protein